MVAPGIAEALIATAIGLFAAIPAVIAYNRYADQVSRLELRYDAFMEEFSTILQRYAGRAARLARSTPWLPHNPAAGALMGEINVVPYIDVMLVLLIIFMVTAPLLAEGIKVELPKAGARPIPPEMLKDAKPIVLTIDEQGRLFLNYNKPEDEPLDRRRGRSAGGRGAAPCARDRGAGARRLPRGLWRSRRRHDHPAARRREQGRLRHRAAGTRSEPAERDAAAIEVTDQRTLARDRAVDPAAFGHRRGRGVRLVHLEASAAAAADAGHRGHGGRRARVEGHRAEAGPPPPEPPPPEPAPEPEPAPVEEQGPPKPDPAEIERKEEERLAQEKPSSKKSRSRKAAQELKEREDAERVEAEKQAAAKPRRKAAAEKAAAEKAAADKKAAEKKRAEDAAAAKKAAEEKARLAREAELRAQSRGRRAGQCRCATATRPTRWHAQIVARIDAGLDQATLGTARHLVYCVGHPGSGRRGDSRPREQLQHRRRRAA